VENLFDTIPSPFYYDREWTPRGANRWGTERYRTKIENLARVIDDLGADIMGLAEVENEAAVRDLVTALKTDYNYIHLTSGDARGIDLALLYKGDKFFPDGTSPAKLIPSATGREFLHVRGELLDQKIDLVVCHMASNLNSASRRRQNIEALGAAIDDIRRADPAAAIITMGDMNATPTDKLVTKTLGPVTSPRNTIQTPHAAPNLARGGSYNYRGRWYLYDWMTTTGAVNIRAAGIHAAPWMVEGTPPAPHRTFQRGDYRAGYSDHFPVWIVVVK
jgi:endonuclease/exonuclease/phosphatase family metal-dependent hydrolase